VSGSQKEREPVACGVRASGFTAAESALDARRVLERRRRLS
jgi:hypothetical protein